MPAHLKSVAEYLSNTMPAVAPLSSTFSVASTCRYAATPIAISFEVNAATLPAVGVPISLPPCASQVPVCVVSSVGAVAKLSVAA